MVIPCFLLCSLRVLILLFYFQRKSKQNVGCMDSLDSKQQISDNMTKPSDLSTGIHLPICLKNTFCTPPIPDSRLSWMVLGLIFISSMLTNGLFLGTYGTITVALQHKFNVSLSESSLAPTLNQAIQRLSGPLSSWFIRRFSCRTAHITGAALLVIGLGSCAFATQIWQFYIVYGIMAGVGYSLCGLVLPATIPHYFIKHKHVAFPTVALGAIIGCMIWPVVTQALFTKLGFSLTMGMIGLLECVQIMSGSFFNERDLTVKDGDDTNKNEEVHNSLASSSDYLSGDKDEAWTGHSISFHSVDETTQLIAKHKELENQNDMLNTNTQTSSMQQMSFLTAVKSLYKDWKVWCLNGIFGLFVIPFLGFKLFAIDYVVRYCGLTEAAGALGISISAMGALLAVFLMIVLSKVRFDRLYVFCMMPAAFGCCSLLVAFTNGKVMYYVVAFVCGITRGGFASTKYTVSLELREPELFHIIYGFNLLIAGVSVAIAGPVFSYLQSNVNPIGGWCFGCAAGVLGTLVILPVVVHRIKSTSKNFK